MGSLHAGHLSLVRRARQSVGKQAKVVVSLYVNPTQFGPKEDFARYPRNFARDAGLCRAAGVDVLFAPGDDQMYPADPRVPFSTYIAEEDLSRGLEGKSRPTHFRGVTTIVAKLFHLVQPTVAVFGAKDWQQAAIVKRMTRDLNFGLKIITAPIVREPDGLALSSRNQYLKGELRTQALVLWRSIQRVRAALRRSARPLLATRMKAGLKEFIERQPDARLDYVEFFEPENLAPVAKITPGTHMALAVFIGRTRLIDNSAL